MSIKLELERVVTGERCGQGLSNIHRIRKGMVEEWNSNVTIEM